jgi:hypothetical protein
MLFKKSGKYYVCGVKLDASGEGKPIRFVGEGARWVFDRNINF